jgi:hypothetical protein
VQSIVTCAWKDPGVTKRYRTAVSIHGHTSHSRESLSFIPNMASSFAPLHWLITRHQERAKKGQVSTVDFKSGYWTPPLPPLSAFQLERNQIESTLDMPALVSLSDHDSIEAPMLLRVIPESQTIPVSLEWSVPFSDTVFHLGVHNLPPGRAVEIVAQLNALTDHPEQHDLHALLAMLHTMPEVLIVLNHPLWDLPNIGREKHRRALSSFVAEYGIYMHAFELGGLRPWEENHEVVQFAQGWNQLIIAGGDRHGCEPSAVLNLTEAESFAEFVHQVRVERRSHVLFMPQYQEPLALRIMISMLDVLRDYPDYRAGSRRWDERVFHPNSAGESRPLSELWSKPPAVIDWFVKAVHLLESAPLRRVMKLALAAPQKEPGLVPDGKQEVAQ